MTDQDLRDFLERMSVEEPTPFLDAEPLAHRARRRAARTAVVGAVGVAAMVAVLFAGVAQIRTAPIPADVPTPSPVPSVDLGIFAPVAGRIVYGDGGGIRGVDPAAPADPATRVELSEAGSIPLGWSSDGTQLLVIREFGNGLRRRFHLFVIHADGSETQVTERPMRSITGATISPDGSRVVFATSKSLYSVEVGGGRPLVLLEAQDQLWASTFSPDGTQIAYVVGSGDSNHRVWVVDADGSDAHQILANETTLGAGHVYGLSWSPADDRIALGLEGNIYTFATDGSDFARLITDGDRPYWSPDGSQLVYSWPVDYGRLEIANADGSDARLLGVATSSGPWTSGPWNPAPLGASRIPADVPTPSPAPSVDLGIFAPVAGRIVYGDRDGIWGVDPAAPAGRIVDSATRVQLTSEPGDPLAWSSDGTRLLIQREFGNGRRRVFRLFVMHADGSETQVTDRPIGWITGATISPDGSRVVFATYKALYGVDVGGGRPVVLLEAQGEVWAPTFSPDGAQIAYVDGSGDSNHRVWAVDADGSDAHEILANATTLGGGHVYGLAWSPAGDRIALGTDYATYTFATDGSGFTQVLDHGNLPYWSPDGSQLAYSIGASLGISDADGSDARVFGAATSGPWHPGQGASSTIPTPTPTKP